MLVIPTLNVEKLRPNWYNSEFFWGSPSRIFTYIGFLFPFYVLLWLFRKPVFCLTSDKEMMFFAIIYRSFILFLSVIIYTNLIQLWWDFPKILGMVPKWVIKFWFWLINNILCILVKVCAFLMTIFALYMTL